jgi:hypothetical protein
MFSESTLFLYKSSGVNTRGSFYLYQVKSFSQITNINHIRIMNSPYNCTCYINDINFKDILNTIHLQG